MALPCPVPNGSDGVDGNRNFTGYFRLRIRRNCAMRRFAAAEPLTSRCLRRVPPRETARVRRREPSGALRALRLRALRLPPFRPLRFDAACRNRC